MPRVVDAKEGDEYSISEPGLEGRFRFVRQNKDASIVLKNLDTKEIKVVGYHAFVGMRGRSSAVRVVREGVETKTESLGPFNFLDADDPKISIKERKKRTAARNRVTKARVYHLCLERFDDDPDATTYEPSLNAFREKVIIEAGELGFDWVPSVSQIRKALAKYGKKGNRPFGQVLGTLGRHENSKWPDWVIDLKNGMIEYYWGERYARIDTAKAKFVSEYDDYCVANGLSVDGLPGDTTLTDWINKSETKERWEQKYGKRSAHKRHVGTVESVKATRPLEYVVLDQTHTDIWLIIIDSDGNVVGTARAWLVYALDVFSDMILGSFLTFEPPSIYSLMKCIKLVCQPNYALEERFGAYKGATDGWGKPTWFILDNGMENVGVSLKTVLQAVGIDVTYASLRTPEHKAKVERIFGITNALWHQLPGGRPGGKDKRGMEDDDSRKKATLTLPQANRKQQEYIVKSWHVEAGDDGLKPAPAQRWAKGIKKFGRPTVDDPRLFDNAAGMYGRAIMTTNGVRYKGERFHSPALVSLLVRNMAFRAKKRKQRGPGQSIVLDINVFSDPMDCSFLNVLDETTGQLVRLPNVYPESTRGLSWAMSKEVRAYVKREKLSYHNDIERAHARWALYKEYQEKVKKSPSNKELRRYSRERVALEEDFDVEEVRVDPSIHGMNGVSIPTTAPVSIRGEHGLSPKGPKRGGKISSASKTKSRAKKQSETEDGKAMAASKPQKPVIEIGPQSIADEKHSSSRVAIEGVQPTAEGQGDQIPDDIQAYLNRRATNTSRRL